jgi:hypothetical protein
MARRIGYILELEHSHMDRPKLDPRTSVSTAAAQLEAELERFESMSHAAAKVRASSEKGLLRAARALREAAECEERVAAQVGVLIAAIGAARERQEGATRVLQAAALDLQARTAEFQRLAERLAEIGSQAKVVTTTLAEFVQIPPTAAESGPAARLDGGEVRAQLAELTERARQVGVEAASADIVDLARDADAVRQQLASALAKLDGLMDVGEASARH